MEVVVGGESLGADGTLMDVGLLQRILGEALTPLLGRDLDVLPVFQGKNTTAEVVAHHFFTVVQSALRRADGRLVARVVSLRVTVWESPEVFARFEGPLSESGLR